VTLRELVSQAPSLAKPPATPGTAGINDAFTREVTGLSYDSRQVTPGSVFIAMRGQKAEGAQFARQALERGAQAVVADTPPPAGIPAEVPWLETADARLALAELAAAFFGHPSHALTVVGITGTNGKTTTSYLTAAIFDRAGIPCGVIGTVGYRLPPADMKSKGEEREAARTTPEAPDVQALLAEMASRGAGACVMEVSSHALELRRADGIRFAGAIFTNLTRDHLDFHGDMETYYAAKRRLFEMLPSGAPSAINVDDPRGSALAGTVSRPVTYALDRPADVTAGPLSLSIDGLSLDVRTPRGALRVRSRLVGRPNAYNILAAVACAVALDIPLGSIEQGIAALEQVPGRFQVVSQPGDDVRVVVDYAHTDDALKNLLETARPLSGGRVITVFGCGGDRDATKRPLMGAVAGRLSDLVIVTSDNPRSEPPERIIEDIKRGLTPARVPWLAIVDRAEAIDRAVREARAGDLVLVAGKGHEKTQTIGTRVLPFDDVDVARAALSRRRTGSHVG
jgi:UDP-N-acetylmuramoyl-L-alanyl-D-glutamate--2,6-diaminopimelate ligase